MKLLEIIREQVLLNENIAQAEKILNRLNIPLDDREYLSLKDTLLKNGNIRYLGFLLSLSFEQINKTNSSITSLFNLSHELYNEIKNNEEYIRLLPKSFFDYKTYNELVSDLRNLKGKSNCIKFSKLIINKKVKDEFINNCDSNSKNIEYYFNHIEGTKLGAAFKKKINRHYNIRSLIDYLNQFIKLHQEGFIYGDWKKKIVGNSENFKMVYDDPKNERILVLTKTWEGVKAIGSPSWCIYQSHTHFIGYTKEQDSVLYVFLDFSADDLNYSIIGFTMNDDGEVVASHLMDDQHISNVTNYLKDIGVYYQFKTINHQIKLIIKNNNSTNKIQSFKERFIWVINNKDEYEDTYDYEDEYKTTWDSYIREINELLNLNESYRIDIRAGWGDTKKIYLYHINVLLEEKDITSELFTSRLTNFLKIFQDVLIEQTVNKIRTGRYLEVNLFNDDLLNLDKIGSNKDMVNNSLINVFTRYKDLKRQTYNWFIKKLMEINGREKVFEIIRQRKERSSEEYSHVEFFNIKDKKNMVPQIIEKIKKSRREGIIDLTPQEVKYGIENGLKDQLVRLYIPLIPYFKEYQVDYDSMTIYKELGLIKQLTDAVVYKVNVYGIDTLNSIEHSLYQYKDR